MNVSEAVARRKSVRQFLPDPVSDATITELLQLAAWIVEVLQHIKADNRVEPRWQRRGLKVAEAAHFVLEPKALSPGLHKAAVLGIEIHKPHRLHLRLRCSRQGVGADATAEIEHVAAGELGLQPQGVGDVIGAAQMPGGQLQQVASAHRGFVEGLRLIGIKRPWMGRRQRFGRQGQAPL